MHMTPLTDREAWQAYPHHRWVFNKLDLALMMGYVAGPCGTSVPIAGDYIVRPIYNLSGMGAQSRKIHLERGDCNTVKPGEFWCEPLPGQTISIDYKWVDGIDGAKMLKPIFASRGIRTVNELYRFNGWKRIAPPYWNLPQWINDFRDVPQFNIEFIENKIIEIHLRPGIDFPDGATCLIPVWSDMTDAECSKFLDRGYEFVPDYDDADGHLPVARLGFLYR